MAEDCQSRPGVARMLGPQIIGASTLRASLVFNAAFPCGVERDAAFAPANDRPLKVLTSFGACVPGGPGDRAIVRGSVLARDATLGPGLVRPSDIALLTCQPGVYNTALRVKLRITLCDVDAAPVLIDSDSAVVVPAGAITVDVLVPGDALALDGAIWSEGSQTLAGPVAMTGVMLRVSACPLRGCWCPKGQLSEYIRFANADAVADRILLKPQRARRLQVFPSGISMNVNFLQDITSTLNVLGAFNTLVASGFGAGNPVELFGASPAIELDHDDAGEHDVYLVWEID